MILLLLACARTAWRPKELRRTYPCDSASIPTQMDSALGQCWPRCFPSRRLNIACFYDIFNIYSAVMNKVLGYMYVAVVVLALLAVAVVWNSRKAGQQPVVSPLPSGSTAPEVSIKYNSDGSIDTSDWLTFRHEVYPYEIKYPRGAKMGETNTGRDDFTMNTEGKGIYVALDQHNNVSFAGDVTGVNRNVNDNIKLREYINEMRGLSLGHGVEPLPPNITDIEKKQGVNWQGFQFTTTQAIANGNRVDTRLFILHDGKVYCINYNKEHPLSVVIVSTFRFLD